MREDSSSDTTGSSAWPAVGWERLQWERGVEQQLASRRQTRIHTGPYEASIPATICHVSLQLSSSIAADVEDATAAIIRFDAELGSDIAAFRPLLLRLESMASSQIEHLTASAKAILAAEVDTSAGANARKIVAATRAMEAAVGLAHRLDRASFLEMHAALMRGARPESAGRLREQQVWVGGTGFGPHSAVFVPPHHGRVAALMDDLVAFLARDDLPVLAHAALAHAQFETIHPFTDGNGRVGRALVQAVLHGKGISRNAILPVSSGLLSEVAAYFHALGSYREGDPEPIIGMFVDATFAAIANGQTLVADLESIRAAWQEQITARSDATIWPTLDLLLARPVVTVAVVVEQLGVSRQAATNAVNDLVDAGILSQAGGGQRYRRWAAAEVLDALDAFAARAGRRKDSRAM